MIVGTFNMQGAPRWLKVREYFDKKWRCNTQSAKRYKLDILAVQECGKPPLDDKTDDVIKQIDLGGSENFTVSWVRKELNHGVIVLMLYCEWTTQEDPDQGNLRCSLGILASDIAISKTNLPEHIILTPKSNRRRPIVGFRHPTLGPIFSGHLPSSGGSEQALREWTSNLTQRYTEEWILLADANFNIRVPQHLASVQQMSDCFYWKDESRLPSLTQSSGGALDYMMTGRSRFTNIPTCLNEITDNKIDSLQGSDHAAVFFYLTQ